MIKDARWTPNPLASQACEYALCTLARIARMLMITQQKSGLSRAQTKFLVQLKVWLCRPYRIHVGADLHKILRIELMGPIHCIPPSLNRSELPGFRIAPRTRNIPTTKNNKMIQTSIFEPFIVLFPLFIHSKIVETQPRGHWSCHKQFTSWAAPETPRRAIDRRCHLRWERKTASMKRRSWIQHW